jgi:hypothetical protein
MSTAAGGLLKSGLSTSIGETRVEFRELFEYWLLAGTASACTAAPQGVDTQAHVTTLAGKHRRPVGGVIWLELAGRAGAEWQTGQGQESLLELSSIHSSQYSNFSRVLLRSHYSTHE